MSQIIFLEATLDGPRHEYPLTMMDDRIGNDHFIIPMSDDERIVSIYD
jgi:hypothetical protein